MKEFLDKQSENMFLWVPMLMAFGAALYFALSFEPNILYPAFGFIACVIGILFFKKNFLLRAATLFLGGFLYATFYTQFMVSTPKIKYPMRDLNITATVTDFDVQDNKTRIILSVPADILGASRDAIVRVSTKDDPDLQIGDVIRARVGLFPPANIEAPESFDYARWAYFNNLTATGFIQNYRIVKHNDTNNINSVRNTIHEKANSFLTDGLVLGYKNSVPKIDKDTWTIAGVGHIWSISGFHMTLIGGWLFAFFYLICRSIGFITRRIPARIIATICAWITLFAYVCISGIGVATMRAFLMTSLVFAALLLGRNAISMRNICIAFLILFVANPHFITQSGFQLSFAAIFGLIWFWGDKKFVDDTTLVKVKHGLYSAAMTAIVATLFTLPFIATHFSSVPLYSLLGNLILLPIFSVAIMPLVIIGTICAIFGGHLFLHCATSVYNWTLHIAQYITSLPNANLGMPHIPDFAFALFIIGLLCLIFIKPIPDSQRWIFRKVNYVLCAICVLIGIIFTATRSKPVFYITPDHELIGMVYDGKLEFNKARAANHYFAFDAFRKLNNEPHSDTNIRRKCPDGVCMYETENFKLAYIQKFVPLMKNFTNLCRDDSVNFIVSYFDIDAPRCAHKILRGGFVIYNSGKIQFTPSSRWWHNLHE